MAHHEAPEDLLSRLATGMGVDLSPAQRSGMMGFCELLLRWNASINLTATRSLEELVGVHLPDSLVAARVVSGTGAVRVVDVGSGGGMPALPLALLAPDAAFDLYEPTGKKVAFLRTAVRELGMASRIRVLDRRLDPGVTSDHDIAMSRATFAPEEWLRVAASLVRPGGQVLAFIAAGSVACPPGLTLTASHRYQAGTAPRQLLVYRRP